MVNRFGAVGFSGCEPDHTATIGDEIITYYIFQTQCLQNGGFYEIV